jgi:hypothetical protein
MGIRYVVVPEQVAPAPFSSEPRPTPPGFKATLDAQLDLQPLDEPAGLTVYRNQAFVPERAALPPGSAPPPGVGIAAAADLDLSQATTALPRSSGELRWTGPVQDNTYLLFAAAHSPRWQLTVDGQTIPSDKPFGWALGYPIQAGGKAALHFRTPPQRYLLLVIEVLAWLAALRAIVRVRLTPGPARSEPLADWDPDPLPGTDPGGAA